MSLKKKNHGNSRSPLMSGYKSPAIVPVTLEGAIIKKKVLTNPRVGVFEENQNRSELLECNDDDFITIFCSLSTYF